MKKIILITSVILVTLLTTAALVIPIVMEHLAIRTLSSSKVKEYDEWRHRKISLPAGVLSLKPFTAETADAARAFREAYANWPDSARVSEFEKLNASRRSLHTFGQDPDSLDQIRKDLASAAPSMQALEHLISQPDYEILALTADEVCSDAGLMPSPDVVALQRTLKMFRLKARVLARDGQYEESFQYLNKIIQGGRVSPYNDLVNRLMNAAFLNLASGAWIEIASVCPDSKILRHALTRQREITARQISPDFKIPPAALWYAEALRNARLHGMRSKMPSAYTASQCPFLINQLESKYLQEVALPAVQANPSLAREVEKRILGRKEDPGPKVIRLTGWDRPTYPALFSMMDFDWEEAAIRLRVSIANLDLLRLETARRIYVLEHGGKPPVKMSDLVEAQLLPEIPKDLFGDGSQVYRESADGYYSLGPDKKSQQGALPYDPTNGSVSVGDLVLRK